MRSRNLLSEINGAMGDMGVLFPLALGLITINRMSPAAVFGVTGLVYAAAALYFKIPMPVQPQKAFVVLAISQQLSPGLIQAGALWMGALFLVFTLFRRFVPFEKLFSFSLIKGIQAAVGLLLIKQSLDLLFGHPLLLGAGEMPLTDGARLEPLAFLFTLGGALLLWWSQERDKGIAWAALLVVLGLWISLAMPAIAPEAAVAGAPFLFVSFPTVSDFAASFFLLVIPQVPLTMGNSVMATADAAKAYFGPGARRVTAANLCASLGFSNLAAGLLGGMPLCHGSGGLTAHYHLGSRTRWSTLGLGAGLLLLAALPSPLILRMVANFPTAILSCLLLYAGARHVMLIKTGPWCPLFAVVILTVSLVTLFTRNLFLGAGLGWLIERGWLLALKAAQKLSEFRERRVYP